MEIGTVSAVIAAGSAICLAYINGFVVERYKRHHEGSAIAAGLAGELGSYEGFAPKVRGMLEQILGVVEAQTPGRIVLRPFDRPRDLFYEAAVQKLGLLDVAMIEDVVFVYGNLGGFRIALELLSKHHTEMIPEEIATRSRAAIEAIDRALDRSERLMPKLRSRATERFLPAWAITGR